MSNAWKNEFYINSVLPYEKYELMAIERIINKYNTTLIKRCNTNAYDFKMSDGLKYEVKADLRSVKTCNFYIEHFGYGKPSGLSVSKAHYYIITDGTNNYYMIATDKLKELCKTHGNFNIKETQKTKTLGYIIPINLIISNSIII